MNYRNTLVTSVAVGGDTTLFLASAKYHGIEITFADVGPDWVNLYEGKCERFWKWASVLTGYDHIIFVDAFDSLFATGLGEIHTKFQAIGKPFVMSTEQHCWPLGELSEKFTGPERYRFINSGFFIATWDAFLREFPKMMHAPLHPNGWHDNDQARWINAFAGGHVDIALDRQCELCQCLYGTDGRWHVLNPDITWNKRPRNLTTGSYPCVIHANGSEKWRLSDAWDFLKV